MKTRKFNLAICLVALFTCLFVTSCSCNEDDPDTPTTDPECENVCAVCGQCFDESCTLADHDAKCTCVITDAAAAQKMAAALKNSYKGNPDEARYANFNLPKTTTYDGTKADHSGSKTYTGTVVWTVAYVSGTENVVTMVDNTNNYVATLDLEACEANSVYKITASVTVGNATAVTSEFDIKVNPVTFSTIAQIKAAAVSDTNLFVKGWVVAVDQAVDKSGTIKQSYILQDETGFIFSYESSAGVLEVGDYVSVVGTRSANYELPQLTTKYVSILDPGTETTVYDETDNVALDAFTTLDVTVDQATGYATWYTKVLEITNLKVKSVDSSNRYVSCCIPGKTAEVVRIYCLAGENSLLDQVGKLINVHGYMRGFNANSDFMTIQLVDYEITPEPEAAQKIELNKTGLTIKTDFTEDVESYALPTAGTVWPDVEITWSLKEATTLLTLANNAISIDHIENGTVVLIATFSIDGAENDTKEITITLHEDLELDKKVAVKTPEVGVDYYFGLKNTNSGVNKWLLANGKKSSISTVDDIGTATKYQLEEATGGYYLSTMVGTTKKYLNASVSGDNNNFSYDDTKSTVWTWNADHYTLVTTLNGHSTATKDGEYYMGSYGDKVTLSFSATSHLTECDFEGATNFCAKLLTIKDRRTNAQKVEADEALLDIKTLYTAAAENVELPTAGSRYASAITWALVGTPTGVTLVDNVLNIAAFTSTQTINLTATFTLNGVSDDYDVTIECYVPAHAGTVEDPYTLAEFVKLVKDYKAGDESPAKFNVVGKVTNYGNASGTVGRYNMYISDDAENSVLVYNILFMTQNETVIPFYLNDTIVVSGYVKNYNGTLEFYNKNDDNKVYASNYTRGQGTVTVTPNENATITCLTTSGTNASTFDFTVVAKEGYKIDAVKVNGTAIEGVDGTYTTTIQGETIIEVQTSELGKLVLPSFVRNGENDTVLGGTLTSNNIAKKTGYYQPSGSAGAATYVQVLNTTALFTNIPTSITVTCSIGAGQAKTGFTEANGAIIVLLDSNGNEISGMSKCICKDFTKDPSTFTVTFNPTSTDIAGVKFKMNKVDSWNYRLYSMVMTVVMPE